MKIYRAAQVAQKLGISKQTLLRYEKKGIFQQSRRNHINSWREYTEEDVRKLKTVLNRGYTVMEIVIVIVIVGILAAVAIPRFSSFYSIKLSGAMKKVVSDIRYTQQIALARNTNTRIVFNNTTDRYEVQEETPRNSGNWTYIKDPFTRADLVVDYRSDPQYRGIDINATNFVNNTLQFDWQGVPRNGGQVNFTYQDNTNVVVVQNGTGIVRVQ